MSYGSVRFRGPKEILPHFNREEKGYYSGDDEGMGFLLQGNEAQGSCEEGEEELD